MKISGGSPCRLSRLSQARPRGCTTTRAMTGVIETLGYRREKNRLVPDPIKAQSKERVHIRGAVSISACFLLRRVDVVLLLIDADTSSMVETDALT